uniref:Uncharacterized protein n=1 Tax=Daphnia galeata TaxID=27404 RepID=A0A8J2RZ68_9CRUS|nr:unnamed protein product [Daphnia galeata]
MIVQLSTVRTAYRWTSGFTRLRAEGWPSQLTATLMAIIGIGLSSFSAAQMSAMPASHNKKYFPRGPWN